jgi:predicted amidohydrolase
MRVLLVQAEPAPGDPEANARAAAAAIAAHPTAELAVFPELFLTGYDLEAAAGRAIAPVHPALAALRETAARTGTAVVAGFAELLPDGGLANSVACIDTDGAWAGTYRKTHLFGREGEVFRAGERLLAVELAGRRIGLLVCFDVEFPEPARALAFEGAELLVTVSANMTPYGPDHDLAARARALDNRLPHVYVNRAGSEGGFDFVGASMAIGPDGGPLLTLGPSADAAVAELDLDAGRAPDVDYLHHLRADLTVEVPTTTSFQGGTR